MASEKRYRYILYGIIVLGMIFSLFLIIFQTNLIFIQDGTIASRNIDLYNILGDEVGGGYIQLDRSSETPSFLELVKFENGIQHSYFTIEDGERLKKKVILDIPEGLESGDYYVDYNIIINGKSFTETLKVRVIKIG